MPVAGNITSSAQIAAVNASVQRAVRGRGYPAFIGIDQEGGAVVRMRGAATRFPSFMSTGSGAGPDLTRLAARPVPAEMRGLGFTSAAGTRRGRDTRPGRPGDRYPLGLGVPGGGSRAGGRRPARHRRRPG